MKKILGLTSALTLAASVAQAAPILWESENGGNGHSYELVLVDGPISWEDASAVATASGGYLATVTSADEWAFVDTFVNPDSIKAWLGGMDTAAEGVWTWVTTEAWTFDYWGNGEPDNNNFWYGEDYLAGWWFGDYWNDAYEDGYSLVSAFVVENNMAPVPVPASLPLLAGGLGLLGLARRRKAKS